MDITDRVRDLAPDGEPSDEDLAAARAALVAEIRSAPPRRSEAHVPPPRRRRFRRMIGVAVSIVAVAAIAVGTWAIAQSVDPARVAQPAATPTPTVTPPPSAALRESFRCNTLVVPASLLEAPVLASSLDADAKAAFEAANASIAADAETWTVVEHEPQRISLIRRDASQDLPTRSAAYQTRIIEQDGGGTWHFWSYAWCEMEVDLGFGVDVARLTLDPESLSAGSSSVSLLVNGGGCASGHDASGRIDVISVEETEDAIHLILGVRSREGIQTCQGSPPTPYTVELEAPVGDRVVLNDAFAEPTIVEPTP